MRTITAIATPNVLNLSVFISTIDRFILSNLQMWWKWYKNISNNERNKINDKVVETQATTAMAIKVTTPNFLNSSVFLPTIDQVILSNFQLQWIWYSNFSNSEIDKISEKDVKMRGYNIIW